jgi:hypothetical protein
MAEKLKSRNLWNTSDSMPIPGLIVLCPVVSHLAMPNCRMVPRQRRGRAAFQTFSFSAFPYFPLQCII